MKAELGTVQETLLIPLYGRARDAASDHSVLGDTKAAEMVAAIDYDFSVFSGPSLPGAVLRSAIFDRYVTDFLTEHPHGTVVELGCGLSTRFDRLDNGTVRWFDIDLPDSIALRRNFFTDSDRYTMVAGSIFDSDWYSVVRQRRGPIFLLSEAVLLYFPAAAVGDVLTRLATEFDSSDFALDTGGAFMMKNQDRNPVFKAVSARMQWICDNPKSLDLVGWSLLQSRSFAQPQPEVGATWPLKYRIGMGALRFTPVVSSYRINLLRAAPHRQR